MNNIFILDGQNDNVIGHINKKYVIDNEHEQSLENRLSKFEMTCIASARHTDKLNKRNGLIVPGEDDELLEFRIFESIKYRDNEGLKVETYALATYLDLKKAKVFDPQKTPSETAFWHANEALEDTGWQVGTVDFKGVRTLEFDSPFNAYEYLHRIARDFELELRFYIKTDGNKVTGRYVDLVERVGEWRGRTVEFGRDLTGISRKENTAEIVTALWVYGPEREDGTRRKVFVEDKDALERWGRHGEHLVEYYEPQTEDQNITQSRLKTLGEMELKKRINAVVDYEIEFVDLEHIPGLETKKVRLGDTIRAKDLYFNPALYVEARVFEQRRNVFDKSQKTVKLGDFVEYTEEEVKAIWKRLEQQIRQKISQAELLEYTYDKLTIDDKDETVFEDSKTFAEATGIRAEENAKAFAVEEDKKIKLDVERYADNVAEQKANSALEQAKMYAVAKEVYDIQMQQIASDIASRAPLEYVDGQLRVIEGELEDFNVIIEEKADKSTVYTIEEVDNRINNLVSVTQYTTDMDGIVAQLESHGTRIGQNEHAIGLKADASYVDNVKNELTRKIGNVEVTAEGAYITASEVRADLDGLEIGGRNLLLDSHFYNSSGGWQARNSPLLRENDVITIYANGSNIGATRFELIIVIKEAGVYTLSAKVKATTGLQFRGFVGTTATNQSIHQTNNEWTIISTQFEITEPEKEIIIRLYLQDGSAGQVASMDWAKLEKGNKATDWSPAPEDTDEAINQVSGRVETLDGEITALAGEVSLKASQSVVDSLEERVSTAEGELRVLPGQIEAKVSKDGVIGAINATPEQLLIDFDKVKMTGELEAKHIKSLNGLNVNNQFIVDNSGNVTFAGHLQGATGTFSGTVETARLVVNNPNIEQDGIGGMRLQVSQWQESTTKPYKKTGYIDFRTDNNSLEIQRFNERGNFEQLDGFLVAAKKMLLLGNLELAPWQAGAVPQIIISAGRSDFSSIRWNANSSVDYGLFIKHEGDDILKIKKDIGLEILKGDIHSSGRLYLRPSGTNHVYVANSSGNWRNVYASDFIKQSDVNEKKNIELYTENALQKILDTPIYNYHYKSDLDAEPKRIGVMLQESPLEIVDIRGEGIESHSMSTLSWKAIQEIYQILERNGLVA